MKLRHRIEAWAMAGLVWLVGRLPVETASNLGGALGRWIGPRLGVSRRALDNLALAFPERDAAWRRRIVRAMWDNLGRTAFELAHLGEISDPAGPWVQLEGAEHAEAFRTSTRPRLFVSGHLANWEVMATYATRLGLPIVAVERRPNNPLIAPLLERLRASGGSASRRVPKGSKGAREVLAELRRGGAVAMLIDQKMNDGIEVPFFGRPAMTAVAPAQLALRSKAEILLIQFQRLGAARFRLVARPYHPASDDPAEVTADLNRVLEGWIREKPEDWLWLHRRWGKGAASS